MNKLIDFLKKRYIWVICLLVIIVILAVIGLKKGTFGINNTSANVSLECHRVIGNNTFMCGVILKTEANNQTLENFYVQASYDLPASGKVAIREATFGSDCNPQNNNCFEVVGTDEDGFGLRKTSFTSTGDDVVLGTILFEIDERFTHEEFTVGLKDVLITYIQDQDEKTYEQENIAVQSGVVGVDDSIKVAMECHRDIGETTFMCGVILNTEENQTFDNMLVEAKYNLPNSGKVSVASMSSNDCSPRNNDCFDIETTEDGFRARKETSFTSDGDIVLGTILFEVDEQFTHEIFSVGLKDIEILFVQGPEASVYGQSNILTQPGWPSSDATLSNLVVAGSIAGVSGINESTGISTYDVDVSSDTASTRIIYDTTNQEATVSGTGALNGGLVNLHYGSNEFTLIVTAEDGETTKQYDVIINRPYLFSQNIYTFIDEQNSVIYTGSDTDTQIVNKLRNYDNSVHYVVNDGELKVYADSDDTDPIATITLARMGVGLFDIDGRYLRATRHMTYGEIKNNSYNVRLILSIGHSGANQVVDDLDTVIYDDYLLDVRYPETGSAFLPLSPDNSYTFRITEENPGGDPGETPGGDPGGTPGGTTSLTFDSPLYVVDTDNIIIVKNTIRTINNEKTFGYTGTELSGKIHGATSVSFAKSCANGAQSISDSKILNTGACVIINTSNDTVKYTLSVIGDITGDGELLLNDIGVLYRYYLYNYKQIHDVIVDPLEKYNKMAGDLINDGEIDLGEIGELYRKYYLPTRKRVD